jgi:hypothetical protein
MRFRSVVPALALALVTASNTPSHAAVAVSLGTSWDGPDHTLQKIVDSRYGPGHINVATDYIGAHAGDPDPWSWVGDKFSALIVTEVAGNANRNTLGWYCETFTTPVLLHDGVHDGVVFDGPAGAGATKLIVFAQPLTKFGFYLDPNGPLDAPNAPQPESFFSDRMDNDQGPTGNTALHAPVGGDMQALIFDVSAWTQPNTWLVCFEDTDAGALPGPAGSGAQTDDDYNDFVFEVSAFGATPVTPTTLGALRTLFRTSK